MNLANTKNTHAVYLPTYSTPQQHPPTTTTNHAKQKNKGKATKLGSPTDNLQHTKEEKKPGSGARRGMNK